MVEMIMRISAGVPNPSVITSIDVRGVRMPWLVDETASAATAIDGSATPAGFRPMLRDVAAAKLTASPLRSSAPTFVSMFLRV
jgi:hypothetical protein